MEVPLTVAVSETVADVLAVPVFDGDDVTVKVGVIVDVVVAESVVVPETL